MNNKISYPESGNMSCYELENKSYWFRQRNHIISIIVQKRFKNGVFADVGGGNGYVCDKLEKQFPELSFILVEPGPDGCRNARQRGLKLVFNKTLKELSEYPYLENIGIFDVIEHIQDDNAFLKELYLKLKSGGKVFLTTPAYGFLWSKADENAGHFRRYTITDLKKKAEIVGFQIEYSSYFFATLLPLIFLFRVLPVKLGIIREDSTAAEDHAETVLSKWLEKILSCELFLLKHGIHLPFGASIIMCIKKI